MCVTLQVRIQRDCAKIAMRKNICFQGFSLIEVSISLLIVGIVSAIGISQLRLMQKMYAAQKTQSNIDFVVKALGAYCTSTSLQLPFPSEINSNIGYQSKSMKNSFGIIPFKSLGIMEKFAKDGNGRWLLYKMNPNFCKSVFVAEDKSLGVPEFSSEVPDDRLAFIIKVKNAKNEDELSIWYSEHAFVANYTNVSMYTMLTIKRKELLRHQGVIF